MLPETAPIPETIPVPKAETAPIPVPEPRPGGLVVVCSHRHDRPDVPMRSIATWELDGNGGRLTKGGPEPVDSPRGGKLWRVRCRVRGCRADFQSRVEHLTRYGPLLDISAPNRAQ